VHPASATTTRRARLQPSLIELWPTGAIRDGLTTRLGVNRPSRAESEPRVSSAPKRHAVPSGARAC
jgi:hypothetical protein